MADDELGSGKPVLPGNHGQFGTNVMTEESEILENHEESGEPAVQDPKQTQGPKQTGAGERS